MRKLIMGIAAGAAALAAPAALAADGKEIYAKACAVCHVAMPPKLGDKSAWEPRIKTGVDALVASVIKGKGAMPPRAGKSALSDADIRAAVEYIISESK
ncbi:MAG: cytochrome c5 family protein [Betaproteobacteria bacterium]|nr:cytochrome c5 family protein [Betaproteobacteria bacterium]